MNGVVSNNTGVIGMRIPTFEEVKAVQEECQIIYKHGYKIAKSLGVSEQTFRYAESNRFIRGVWDSVSETLVPKKDTITERLKEIQGPAYFKDGRCFGDLEQYYGMELKDMYNSWVDQCKVKHKIDGKDGEHSIFEITLRLAYSYSKDSTYKVQDVELLLFGFCMMLLRSCEGVWFEGKAVEHLERVYENHPKVYFGRASGFLEKCGIDGILYSKKTKQPVVNISIKSLGGFSEKSCSAAHDFRKNKPIHPHVYVGYEDYNEPFKIKYFGYSKQDIIDKVEAA